jgi:polysaccharide chain length determinant protein (PEP-CTERM system associated)
MSVLPMTHKASIMATTGGRLPAVRPEFLPLSIARSLWKRKLWALAMWLLVSAATVPLVRSLPTVYRAESVILIEGQRIPERYVAATVNDEIHNRLSRLVQQIQSYDSLLEMIERFNLYPGKRGTMSQEEIVQGMREDIGVELVKGWDRADAPAFTISYEGPNPEVVARVANEIRERFIKENLKIRGEQALGTSAFLESQLKAARDHLEVQESRLGEYKRQHNGELPEQADTLMAILNRLEIQLQGVQESMRQNRDEKVMLENALTSAESTAATFSSIAQRVRESGTAPSGMLEPTKIEQAEARLAALRSRYSEDHPEVRRAAAEVERQKQTDAAIGLELAAKKAADPNQEEPDTAGINFAVAENLRHHRERVNNLNAQLSINVDTLQSLEESKQRILAEIANVQSRVRNLPLREQELAKEIRDYDISKANYQSLLNKRMDADVAAEMETRQKAERFTVLDIARVPEKPIKPQRELLIAAGCFAGLLLGLSLAFVVEYRDNVVLGEWEMAPGTVVLGRISPITVKQTEAADHNRMGWRPPIETPRRKARLRPAFVHTLWLGLLVVLVVTGIYKGWGPL